MYVDEFAERLMGATQAAGWTAVWQPKFVSARFRGRDADSDVLLPDGARGLRLGPYPVIVGALLLGKPETLQEQVRALHNQMLIARSYMRPGEIVDAHIFLVCELPETEGDWIRSVDLVERNEDICRKLVW